MSKSHSNQYIYLFMIACLFAGLSVFLQVVPMSMFNYTKHTFFINSSTFANLTSLYFISYALLQIPNGIILDRYGIKKILIIGILITLIGNILYCFSPNIFFIGASRFIIGIGCSIAYLGAAFIAAKFFSPRFLPLCIALIEVFSTVGAILAEEIYSSIIKLFGWNISNAIIIVTTFLILVLSVYFLKKIPLNRKTTTNHFSFLEILCSIKNLMRNKLLLGIFIYSFFCWGILMGFAGFWSYSYFKKMHSYLLNDAFKLSEIYWLSFLFFSLLISLFAKKINIIKRTLVILPFLGFASYAIMCFPTLFNDFQLDIFCIVSGLSASGIVLGFALIPYLVDSNMIGRAMALNNTFIVLGGYVTQTLFGYVKNIGADYSAIILEEKNATINGGYYSGLLLLFLFSFLSLSAIVSTIFNMRRLNLNTK